MIPLRLQLKNFLSYGSDIQTIDFSTYPLICLSGKNGHGKSALLEAITWALWGQARKVSGQSKADHGLLRLGQTQMMVALDFEFNNHVYRIRREFAFNYGKPYAALDFGLLDDNNVLIPLTDKTISATQTKIEQTLNLTFESFSNSAFLRQGQSNEFSKKSPKERKEILASILGLDHYETVRKLAFEKIRTAQAEKTSRLAIQEKIEHELKASESLPVQMAEIAEQVSQLETEAHKLDLKKMVLAQEHKTLIEDQKNHELLLLQRKQLEHSTSEATIDLRKILHEWRTIHKKQRHAVNIADLEQQKKAIATQLMMHQEHLQKNLECKELILKNKELLYTITQQLHTEHTQILNKQTIQLERLVLEKNSIETTVQHHAKTIEQCTQEQLRITQKIQHACTLLTNDGAALQKLTIVEKQFERRKEYYQKFIEQGRWLTTELENLEQKKILAHDDDNPSCPLCEQNLSAARKRFIKQKFSEQEQFLRTRLARITRVVRQLKAILIEQHKELESLKKVAENALMLKHQVSEDEKTITSITRQINELTNEQHTHNTKHKEILQVIDAQEQLIKKVTQEKELSLAHNTVYQNTLQAVAQAEKTLLAIPYNAQEHQHIIAQAQQIDRLLADAQSLHTHIAQQEHRKALIAQLLDKLKVLKQDRAATHTALVGYDSLPQRMNELAIQQTFLEQEIKQYLHAKETVLHKKATLEAQKSVVEKLQHEHKQELAQINALDATIYDYQAIASATSKDGIQALLIEETIPEIEHEANYLLSRLTNNQAHIFIESLRDLKKGGTKETLDIKISDSAGIRPYELFSGGEAFRIDFALRIAISKLLARRAGTSLQTLIIDEGFGSQDEDGLSLIMDTMYKIQDDFAKVIIVSHLPTMKDQFPVHFSVEKGPHGSVVSVIEQG